MINKQAVTTFLGLTLISSITATGSLAETDKSNGKEPSSAVQQLVDGNTHFALDLYDQLRMEEGNLFISPYSVSTALAMTWVGARGETAEQMATTMHFNLPSSQYHSAFGELEGSIFDANVDSRGSELHLANRLWGDQRMSFRDPFLNTVQENYEGGFEVLDFFGATETARQRINSWVEGQTKYRIKELLNESDLTTQTVFVLTNAIYFKSEWQYQFNEQHTHDGEIRHIDKLPRNPTGKIQRRELKP